MKSTYFLGLGDIFHADGAWKICKSSVCKMLWMIIALSSPGPPPKAVLVRAQDAAPCGLRQAGDGEKSETTVHLDQQSHPPILLAGACSGRELQLARGGPLLVSQHIIAPHELFFPLTIRAFWPFETLLIPKRHVLRLTDLNEEEKQG